MPPLLRASESEGKDCLCCGGPVWIGVGGSVLLSEVRRDSGGDMRPEKECAIGPEYGGGGPLEYAVDVGLSSAAVAMFCAEIYCRLVLKGSMLSRCRIDDMPLDQM